MSVSDKSFAIIGAGMAGLSCAQSLVAAGHNVRLFDKGRGPGGRMATRRADVAGDTIRFDHGTQYFKALDAEFALQCEEWRDAGVVADWPEAGVGALVGTPGMNAVIRHMAEPLDVEWGTRIERIEWLEDGCWRLHIENSAELFDGFICATPAEQAAVLLEDPARAFAALARDVDSDPCWAVMVSFDAPLDIAPDILRSEDGPIVWAARNSAKPGREGGEDWVLHASKAKSLELLGESKDYVAELLLQDFFKESRLAPVKPAHLAAHRWLYAFPQLEAPPHSLWDADFLIGVCGDWLVAPNVEGAWLSGQHLAKQILQCDA